MKSLKSKIYFILYNFLISKIPIFNFLRNSLCRKMLKRCGKNIRVSNNVWIVGADGIELDDNVSIARDSTLDGRGGLKIGSNSMIGFESIILSTSHRHDLLEIPMREQGLIKKSTAIGEDVWMGCRVIILAGVSIGKKSIIGAGSIVSKNIPPYSIAAGNPIKILKSRKDI